MSLRFRKRNYPLPDGRGSVPLLNRHACGQTGNSRDLPRPPTP